MLINAERETILSFLFLGFFAATEMVRPLFAGSPNQGGLELVSGESVSLFSSIYWIYELVRRPFESTHSR